LHNVHSTKSCSSHAKLQICYFHGQYSTTSLPQGTANTGLVSLLHLVDLSYNCTLLIYLYLSMYIAIVFFTYCRFTSLCPFYLHSCGQQRKNLIVQERVSNMYCIYDNKRLTLQYMILQRYSKNLEATLFLLQETAKNQYWMPVIFGPEAALHKKQT